MKRSLSHISVALPGTEDVPDGLFAQPIEMGGSLMEPVLHSLPPVLRGVLILGLSLPVFAQIPAAPGVSVFPSDRKAPEFSLTVLPSALLRRRVAAPTCTPGTGVYSNNQNVSCTIAGGATGCFTTSGIPPTAPTPGTCGSGSAIYSGPLLFTVTRTKLQILATESGLTNSSIASYTYTFTAAAPTASPVAGTYLGSQSVTLSTTTSGASIYYSIGGTPTCASTLYTGPITVATSETIKALACETGYNSSTIASFAYKINYTFTQTISGTGSVVSKPVGISCPSTCTATFGSGTVVKLSETPGAGYTFGSWSGGGCSGSSSTCVVTMNPAQSVTATFLPNETLTLTIVGTGSVSSSPSGISCPSTCSATYTYNTSVTLTETPGAGYSLSTWGGAGASCGSATTCTVVMTASENVTATFAINTYALTQTVVGGGSVSSSPAGISCPSACSANFAYNTHVTLTPTPNAGYSFGSWSGACAGSGGCTVSMASAQSVTATFTLNSETLTITVSGTGSLSSSPAGIAACSSGGGTCSASFPYNTVITLTETDSFGWYLSALTNTTCGGGACTITLTANTTVAATFSQSAGVVSNATAAPVTEPFSGLTGSGTLSLDPEPLAWGNSTALFHLPQLRVTDATMSCEIVANHSYFADASDGQDNNFSVGDSQFTFVDSGNNYFIWNFNPLTFALGTCYSGSATSTGFWVNPVYSHVTPKLLYSFSNAAVTRHGTVMSSYNANSFPPTRTTVYDFGSSANGVPSGYVVQSDAVSINQTDTIFIDGFSNSATQNTATIVAAYVVGSGISTLNAATGTITGDFGGTGSAVCQNCPGAPISPGTFTIHDVKASPDGKYAVISLTSCTSGPGTCFQGNDSYLWEVGTVNFYTLCGTGCSGHQVTGFTGTTTQYNTPYYAWKTFASPLTFTAYPGSYCGSHTGIFDSHPSWWNNQGGDQQPFWTSATTGTDDPVYSSCTIEEIISIYTPANTGSSGTITRYAHSYGSPTAQFAPTWQLMYISQTGNFFVYTSSMANSSFVGQLGDTSGNYPCTVAANCRSDVFIGTASSTLPTSQALDAEIVPGRSIVPVLHSR